MHSSCASTEYKLYDVNKFEKFEFVEKVEGQLELLNSFRPGENPASKPPLQYLLQPLLCLELPHAPLIFPQELCIPPLSCIKSSCQEVNEK